MQPATAMPSANMRRAALLVAALLALLWQSFVVQTHVHPAAFAGSPKVENSWQGPLLHRGKASDRGDNCALCQDWPIPAHTSSAQPCPSSFRRQPSSCPPNRKSCSAPPSRGPTAGAAARHPFPFKAELN